MLNAFAKHYVELIPCGTGCMSFYSFVEHFCGGPKALAYDPLHRFCSLMRKMGVRSLLNEELELNDELRAEQEDASKRCQGEVTLRARRFTFFCSSPDSRDWRDDATLPDGHLLGYAVLVHLDLPNKTTRCYVFEAVARPPAVFTEIAGSIQVTPVSHYYIHNIRQHQTSIGPSGKDRPMQIVGSFFAQQNDLTHVCAHACLRMAMNSSPVFGHDKLTNRQINGILGYDFGSPERQLGHYEPTDKAGQNTGVTGEQTEKVIDALGARAISAGFTEKPTVEYDQFIYPLVESGCPVILALEGWDIGHRRVVSHAVSVMGHTLNTDRWAPEARSGYGSYPAISHIPVVEWADHFIISDDNYGMYLTLPTDMIRNFLLPTKNPWLHATRAVGVVPRDVTLSGYLAEQLAVQVAHTLVDRLQLSSTVEWLDRMRGMDLVTRTALRSGSDYANRVRLSVGSFSLTSKQSATLTNLPCYVWVTEVSLPQIYTANKHKLGDVVIRADASEAEHRDGKSFAFAWFPGFSCCSDDTSESWPILGHVGLIRDDDAHHPCEW